MLLSVIPVVSFLLIIISLWIYPTAMPILSIATLLISLALSIYTIIQVHKGTEHARVKILKEVGVMVLTLVIVLFLGGIASMLANAQVSMRWGTVAGLLSAIAASFAACPEPVEGVGYLVRVGMGRSTP